MRRILFVDDDQQVLDGLQNLLRKQRREWTMSFALSAEQALIALEQDTFDVVVTDMRMPIVDGAELLRIVQQRYPGVSRIVLSGHADRDATMRALPVAHQYLSKPCDGDQLRAVIERVCGLKDLIADEGMRGLIGRLGGLPSLPRCYTDLTQALNDQHVGLARLVAIVETDPAMSAKVLQLVNSAYFGLSRQTSSIVDAVRYLGVDLLKGLALVSEVFAPIGRPIPGFSLDALQQHSLLTARLASRIIADPTRADEAFTAGVVHEIGLLVLARAFPVAMAEMSRATTTGDGRRDDAERQAFGVTNAQVGAYLLGVWGLPFAITEAVAYCGSPMAVRAGDRALLAAVHVADAFVTAPPASGQDDPVERIDLAFLEDAGYLERLPSWRATAVEQLSDRVTAA